MPFSLEQPSTTTPRTESFATQDIPAHAPSGSAITARSDRPYLPSLLQEQNPSTPRHPFSSTPSAGPPRSTFVPTQDYAPPPPKASRPSPAAGEEILFSSAPAGDNEQSSSSNVPQKPSLNEFFGSDGNTFLQFPPIDPESTRSVSTLCYNLIRALKEKGPLTRDTLAKETGFARQRVCTVLCVYKAIGLIKECPSKASAVMWNDAQAKKLRNISGHVRELLRLRREREQLEMLEKKLLERRKR